MQSSASMTFAACCLAVAAVIVGLFWAAPPIPRIPPPPSAPVQLTCSAPEPCPTCPGAAVLASPDDTCMWVAVELCARCGLGKRSCTQITAGAMAVKIHERDHNQQKADELNKGCEALWVEAAAVIDKMPAYQWCPQLDAGLKP